jgi:replicative DNA helicase
MQNQLFAEYEMIFFLDQIIFGDNAIDSIFSFSDPYDDNGSIYGLSVHSERREHERRILGGFMSHHIPIETCSRVDFNDFEGKDHQIIFKGIKELYKLQLFFGLDSIVFELDRQNFLHRVGGKDYLKELTNNVYPYTVPLVKMHLRSIKSVSRRSELSKEVRDFIINLRENKNQVFIRPIEKWLNKNVENIEIPIVRNLVF